MRLLLQPATVRSICRPAYRVLTAKAFFIVYYRISGSASLKCAFDPREYIAQLEGIHPSQVEAIYFGVESGGPILDDTRITFVEEGGPGTSVKSPCASSLRETGSDAPFGSPTSATTLPMSPTLNPAPFLRGGRPPSRAFSLPPISYPRDTHIHPLHSSRSTASYNSFKSAPAPYRRATSPQSSSPPDPRWTIGSGGFAEPTESPTEAGKVVSRCRPPGWLSGHVQALGYGMRCCKIVLTSPC